MDLKINKSQMEALLDRLSGSSQDAALADNVAKALGFPGVEQLRKHFDAPKPVLVYTVEDDIREAMEDGEKIPSDTTSLKVKTFDTPEEMQSYIDGADDTAGWGDMFVAANSQGGYGLELVAALREDPNADLAEIWNGKIEKDEPDGIDCP